jgi:hypothetical protein
MALARKAVFMTFAAVILVGLAAAYALVLLPTLVEKSRAEATAHRLDIASGYVTSFESPVLKRMLHGTAYAALRQLVGRSAASLVFYTDGGTNDLAARFNESLLQGLYNGVPDPALTGKHLTAQLALLANLTNATYHFNVSFTPRNATLYQDNTTGPFMVGVLLVIDFTVEAGAAQWNLTGLRVNATVPINGLGDPWIAVSSGGAASNTIQPALFTSWNATGLGIHLAARTYRHNADAP